ncbi:YybH family protein [Xylanimonas sp. McL0601]|uniref:YybH family protein n=1 Tax=Xylanimonas sp. McL0601 TaxID=3414739 RepID=UPI003CEC7DB6
MNREDVMAWVARYEQAWRENDVAAVRTLFTKDARYARSPYDDALSGHAEIEDFWPEDTEFTVSSEPVAVEGDIAVVRLEVHYLGPHPHEYRDLWLLRFAEDGRVADFEEWAHWPGLHYTAPQTPA